MSSFRSDDQIISILQEASSSMKVANFESALSSFKSILSEESNPNIDKFKAAILGMMGECLFSLRQFDDAVDTIKKAIELSEADKDDEGVITSLVNLYEIYRYTSQPNEAISVCSRLSHYFSKLGNVTSQKNYEHQSEIISRGEPLNRVVAVVDGQNYELEDLTLKKVSLRNKSVEFNFLRNRISLPPSKYYCNIASELQSKGEYSAALINLTKATGLDPFDPEPWYNIGIVSLHLEKIDEAIEAFEKTKKLAPGWFDVNHLSWVAQAMKDAKFDLQIFQVLYLLEHGRLTAPQKIAACEKLLTSGHKLPVLMLHLGMAYQQVQGKTDTAENAFRGGLLLTSDLDDDIKTRLLFNLAVTVPTKEEKDKLLNEAKQVGGNLTALAMATATLSLSE